MCGRMLQCVRIEQGLQRHHLPEIRWGGKSDAAFIGTPDGNGSGSTFICLLQAAYQSDPLFSKQKYAQRLKSQERLWHARDKIVVPSSPLLKRRILELYHDNQLSGHVGITKTHDLVARTFLWSGLRADVEDYVRHCDACQRHKVNTRMYAGKLQPLSIPRRRWESVSMDLIVKLPTTVDGHDLILVFVDRLSKMVQSVPTTESLNARSFAALFVNNVVRSHGLPATLISDRGLQSNNNFWAHTCELLGMDKRMSNAFHPQTDGQTRTNRTLEEMLRAYVSLEHDNWDAKLACAEFAINNSWHETVKNTPFFLNYGQHPLTPATKQLPSAVPKAADFVEGIVKSVKEARKFMEAAQQKMNARADKHRREVVYSPGDMVIDAQ